MHGSAETTRLVPSVEICCSLVHLPLTVDDHSSIFVRAAGADEMREPMSFFHPSLDAYE